MNVILVLQGTNDSVERYREWLTLHTDGTWKRPDGQAKGTQYTQLWDKKNELRLRLISNASSARSRIEEYNETLHELKQLRDKSETNKVRIGELDDVHETVKYLLQAEGSAYADEEEMRRKKVEAIEADVTQFERHMCTISSNDEVRETATLTRLTCFLHPASSDNMKPLDSSAYLC